MIDHISMGSLKNNCSDFVNSGSSGHLQLLAGRSVWDATPLAGRVGRHSAAGYLTTAFLFP